MNGPRLLQRFVSTTIPASIKRNYPEKQREKVVVLGSGWAGFKFMKQIDKRAYDIVMVSPKNYFTFTPLLASTSVGTLEFRSAIEPARVLNTQFYEAMCHEIEFSKRKIHCRTTVNQTPFEVEYDRLVIACGAVANTFNIPGVKEHACFLRDISHARKIRHKLLECFEIASQPTTTELERKRLLNFVVVGGGPTGVEFAGELFDFIKDDLERRYPHLRSDISITIYDAAKRLLPSFEQSSSDYTTKTFESRGIRVVTGQTVKEVTDKSLTLHDGTKVPYGLLLWSTGLAPSDLIQDLDLPKDRMKRILTDPSLNVLDRDGIAMNGVYAVGDCASIQGYELPCTAQVAKQKAQYLAQILNAEVGKKTATSSEAFVYRHRGSMAYVGGWKAVVDFEKSKQNGLVGWMIWRAAYMTMAESWRNKIKIPTYWILTWLLGREISRFQ